MTPDRPSAAPEVQREVSAVAAWLTENWRPAATALAFMVVIYSQFEGLKTEQRRTTEATVKLQDSMIKVQIEMAALTRELQDVTGESQRAWDRMNVMREDVQDLKSEVAALKATREMPR
ncbi:MAG: hypothetical protein AAGM38_13945 [Pseudomonadota bacterium]